MSNSTPPFDGDPPELTKTIASAWERVRWPAGRLTRPIFERLVAHLGVPAVGLLLLLGALAGNPVRRVGGGRANACVRYVSLLMQRVIQAESRTVEFAELLRCEHHPELLAILCQPFVLRVRDRDKQGRLRPRRYVPDYAQFWPDAIEAVECKSAGELARDQQRPYPRYVQDEDGTWRYPAAMEACRELGISHRVVTSDDVNPIYVRNLQFLSDFVGLDQPEGPGVDAVVNAVRMAGSMRVKDALAVHEVRPEDLWWLIANRHLWIDWERAPVFELDTSWVHADEAALLTHSHLNLPDPSPNDPVVSVSLDAGADVLWDDVPWRVINRGSKKLVLQKADDSGEIVEIATKSLHKLLKSRSLCCDGSAEAVVRARAERERITRLATTEENNRAIRRWKALEYHAIHGRPPEGVSLVSIHRWQKWARRGVRLYGSAFVGLLRIRGTKPGARYLEEDQVALLEEAASGYVNPQVAGNDTDNPESGRTGTGTVKAVHAKLEERCDRERVVCPSLRTLRREIKRVREASVVRRRCGPGPDYDLEGPVPLTPAATPPHGDRAWQFGVIDHLKLKALLVSSRTGAVLGSVWLTLLVDAYSRMPLGMYLSFDAPARDRVLATLMDCVRRHGRVPDYLGTDQGSDLLSNDVEDGLAVLGMHKIERPARKPRFGTIIERIFRAINTRLVVEVPGSTRHLKYGRSLSRSHHPERLATWTLSDLHEHLEQWLFHTYPDVVNTGIGQTPRERFNHSVALAGERAGRFVPYDRALEIQLAVRPKKRTRVVDPGNGITISYLRYWHDAFDAGDVSGSEVEVKVNPSDSSVVFARVNGQWLDCHLAQGREYLLGRSWRQIRLAVEEMKRQIKTGALASRLDGVTIGRFLRKVDLASDSALARQIQRDAELPPALRFGVHDDTRPGLSRQTPDDESQGSERPSAGGPDSSSDTGRSDDWDDDDDFNLSDLESDDD